VKALRLPTFPNFLDDPTGTTEASRERTETDDLQITNGNSSTFI